MRKGTGAACACDLLKLDGERLRECIRDAVCTSHKTSRGGTDCAATRCVCRSRWGLFAWNHDSQETACILKSEFFSV